MIEAQTSISVFRLIPCDVNCSNKYIDNSDFSNTIRETFNVGSPVFINKDGTKLGQTIARNTDDICSIIVIINDWADTGTPLPPPQSVHNKAMCPIQIIESRKH